MAASSAILIVVVWWWWPTLARDPDRLDVLVVGAGEVRDAAEPIQRRIREEGMSVEVVLVDPCGRADELARLVTEREPAVVVVSPERACDGWAPIVAAARDGSDRDVIVLVQTGASDDRGALDDLDVTVADPSRLLGSATTTRVACLWWDDCEPDGQVTIRTEDGSLTDAGGQRLARVLAGNIA